MDSTLLEVVHPRQVRQAVGGLGKPFGGSRVGGEVGLLLGLRREAAPVVRYQPHSPLLRAHPCQRRGHLPDRGTLIAEAALGEGVARRLLGDLAYSGEDLREALAEVGILLATERSERRRGVRQHIERSPFRASRGSLAWARLWPLRSSGWLAGSRRRSAPTHLRFSGQPGVGASSRSHQGVVGMNLTTDI